MNIFPYLTLLILLHLGCNTPTNIDQDIKAQVDQLQTLADREAFLTKIFEDDQSVRQSNSELIKLNHGEDSKEYKDYVNNQINTDALNLKKVEYYLSKFDHPTTADSFNYKAATAIWAVIQHPDADARERNFEKLYEAQLKGDFDLDWILKRMYLFRNRKQFEMPPNPKYNTELDQLIYELGLEEKKNKVIMKMNS